MTKPRQNSSIWSCVRRRRNGKCRRANGARRKPSSPSCSKTGSSWHDGQPAPHTRFLIVPEAAKQLLERLPAARVLHADKGYDTDALRRRVEANGTLPNIPPKANRVWKNCFSPLLYRARNAIERMFCRLKDFRRIATRYDRLATNFLAAVCIAATVSYWL